MFMPVACVYLPALAWLILPMKWTLPIFGMTYLPWRLLILVASAMNFCAYIAFQFLPESPKFLLSMEKVSASINVLKIVYNTNTRASNKEVCILCNISYEFSSRIFTFLYFFYI